MALHIGIIGIQYLETPGGVAHEFAKELALEASVAGIMSGAGNSVGHFTKPHVGHLLYEYAEEHNLTDEETAQVWVWVETLPWDGYEIELHFNW